MSVTRSWFFLITLLFTIMVGAITTTQSAHASASRQSGENGEKIEYNYKDNKKRKEAEAKRFALKFEGLARCNPNKQWYDLDVKFSIRTKAPFKPSEYSRLKISGRDPKQTLKGNGVWAFQLSSNNPYVCIGIEDTRKYNIEQDFVIWIKP